MPEFRIDVYPDQVGVRPVALRAYARLAHLKPPLQELRYSLLWWRQREPVVMGPAFLLKFLEGLALRLSVDVVPRLPALAVESEREAAAPATVGSMVNRSLTIGSF